MEINIAEQHKEQIQVEINHTDNPQTHLDTEKITKENIDTKASSIQKTKPIKQKSPQRENKSKSPQKNNLQDEMQKYFEEYAVMESIPSGKKLHNQVKTLKKQKQKQEYSQQESNIDQEEKYRYKQLQNKLNFALNKIQICKDTSLKTSKISTQDVDQMYKRFEYYEKKKKQAIQKKKQEKQQEEVRQLQHKPMINSTSSKIVGTLEPIYDRYQRVLKQKQKKLEQQRSKIKKQKQEQQELFFKQFEQRNKRPDKVRTTQQFYEQLVRWKQKNNEKNKQKQNVQNKQLLSGATFKPVINEKSKRILAKKPEREPIFTRQPKPKTIVQQYTFKPKINKKVPSYK